jgi:hypothetical protein
MAKGNRYSQLIVDGKMVKLIIMDEVGGEFILPKKYQDPLFELKGIEILPMSNNEAAEYLHNKWGMPQI